MLSNLRSLNLWIIMLGDALLVGLAYFSSYLIRFDGAVPVHQLRTFRAVVFWIVPVYLTAFAFFKLYKGMWRYTSLIDSVNLFKAVITASAVTIIVVLLLYRFNGFSRGVFIINGLLIFMLVGGFRISIRFLLNQRMRSNLLHLPIRGEAKRLLIIGAGSAGEKLIREILENKNLPYRVVGLIDDNPTKIGQMLHGVRVLGGLQNLSDLVQEYRVDEIAIAIPSASMKQMRRIIDACKHTTVAYKTLPGIGDIIQGKITVSELRNVRYEDMLKRAPIDLDNDLICSYLTDKRVMVTGGAGSIGSELCRQIAAFSPRKLIVLERNESGLYELVLDINTTFPELDVVPVLAAVQNHERMTHIFSHHQPQVVFHAAAYKHVPMMENHPWEAIFNNVEGSRVLLRHCSRFGVERCVMVSTDKAVRPTNVMGATKRLVELLTQHYSVKTQTRLMAVRFGNVLGSVGSVLPLFKKQIAAGGPVTVTDSRMTRFFMTIPEACSLILQSGAYGQGGEIFVLKMGTPVRIDEMARDLISLSGFRPDEDIEIRYTGLRPGEKLYEELITQGEGIQKTDHEEIMVLGANNDPAEYDLDQQVDALLELARQGDAEKIKSKLHDILPEYQPWNADESHVKSDDPAVDESLAGMRARGGHHSPAAGTCLNQVAAEDRMLLQLLSIGTENACDILLEALPMPDWEKIIRSALRHQVASLLYLQLKRSGSDARIPFKINERLRRIYHYFVQISMRQHYWLGKLLDLFNQHGIETMILNGPHLGENIYRNIAARPMSSINLFVNKKNIARLRSLKNEINSLIRQGTTEINILDRIIYPNFEKELDLENIWKQAQPSSIAGNQVMAPCPEDLLLHLCLKFVFFYQFRYAGLQTLCDLREILTLYAEDLDWKRVHQIVQELGVSNAVGLTLLLAEDLIKAPVSPTDIKSFVQENQFAMVKHMALKYIFNENYPYRTLPPNFLELWGSKSFAKKAKALGNLFWSFKTPNSPKTTLENNIRKRMRPDCIWVAHAATSCFKTATMLIFNNSTDVMEQFRIQQQHSLIWEWMHGKKDFCEKPISLNLN